jgi:hypothetical protein
MASHVRSLVIFRLRSGSLPPSAEVDVTRRSIALGDVVERDGVVGVDREYGVRAGCRSAPESVDVPRIILLLGHGAI